jgi:hypothetical protein
MEEPREKCVLDKVCFGPVLTLGAVNPIGIGVHGRINEHFGFVLDYQFMPSISLSNVDAGFSLFTLAGRWHVARSAFFLTLGFSYQSFYAEGEVSDQNGDMVGIDASVGLPQLAFGLGVLGGKGFVIGIDLAFGVPLGGVDVTFDSQMPNASRNPDLAAAYEEQRKDIESVVEDTLELLPMTFQLNLLRIGYLF